MDSAAVITERVVLELAAVLWQQFRVREANVPLPPADYDNTKVLGRLLYTEYVYAFEIAAVLLLVAIVAAIALTLRHRSDTRQQDIARQLATRAADRVRLVDVPSARPHPHAGEAGAEGAVPAQIGAAGGAANANTQGR